MTDQELLVRIDERLKSLKEGDIVEIKESLVKVKDCLASVSTKANRTEARLNIIEKINVGFLLTLIVTVITLLTR